MLTTIRRLCFMLALMPLLTVVACGEPPLPMGPTATPAPIPPPTKAAPTPTPTTPAVKLGVSVPLTGPAAKVGVAIRNFVLLAVDEINAQGGIRVGEQSYRVQPIVVDDEFTPEGAGKAASRLAFGERAHFILGTMSVATAEVQAMAEQNRVLLLAYSAPDRSLGSAFPLTFQIGLPNVRMRLGTLYSVVAADQPGVRRVVLIDGSGPSLTTSGISEVAAQNVGLSVVAKESVKADATDLTPLAHRIIAANPDALDFAAGAGPVFLVLLRTLNDEGFRRPALGLFAEPAAMRDAAPLVEGYVTPLLADPQAAVVGAQERALVQRYIARFGERELDLRPIAMYNAPFLLAEAMAQAGTVDDAAKLAETLRTGEWDTLWSEKWGKARFVGAQTFGLAQILEQPVYFSRIENGEVVTFRALKGTLP